MGSGFLKAWQSRSIVMRFGHIPSFWEVSEAARDRLLRRRVADELVGPLDEPLHIGSIGVAAAVLPPCKLANEQALVDGRNQCGMGIALDDETPGPSRCYALIAF